MIGKHLWGESLSHLIGARWIALFANAVFIVHVGMGSDFAEGHFISTQIYGHNTKSDNCNLQGICFVWVLGIKCLRGRGYYFSGFVTFFDAQQMPKCYFISKIVQTYCEKNLFLWSKTYFSIRFLNPNYFFQFELLLF